MEELVTYELSGEIALVGINRPAKRNAISRATMQQMHAAFLRAGEEARCGILFGHGDHFSGGLDLAEAMAMVAEGRRPSRTDRWHVPLDVVARGAIPWIVAISGACVGGGLEIASAAQIRVADESAFFALPEARRGIFVGGGGTVRIQRLCGYARMADMMLTGRVLTAADAERANLCQYVVPKGTALEKAKELAAVVVTNPANTNWAICAGLPRINEMSHDDGLFFEAMVGGGAGGSETLDRLRAFVERGEAKVRATPDKEQ